MTIGALVSESIQLLWPARCTACARAVDETSRFCFECAPSLTPLLDACPGCALPRDRRTPGGERCGVCRRVPFFFREARAAYEYGAALADAIVRMKHGQRHMARRLGSLLVAALVDALARGGFTAEDVVAPVPLHPSRLRARGFNQALELLRAALAEVTRTPALARPLARGV
ncbi:MAG TPA: double zinc ribbon domain-containing protein, partial [Polyangia bacterium]|nr:double zinc ribbon domain-containing protein [Polyangia bacterium]